MALLGFVGICTQMSSINFVNNIFKVNVEHTSIKVLDYIIIFYYSLYFSSLCYSWQYKDCCNISV